MKSKCIKYLTIALILIYPLMLSDEFRVNLNMILVELGEYYKKDHYEKVFRYLHRYTYALQNQLPQNLEPVSECKNYIWTMWLQGEENAPGIVKNCLKSIRKHSGGRKVVVLTDDTIGKYIQLPQFIIDKYKSKKMRAAIYSDIVRYCLIYKYGGTWIDSTVLLTDNLPKEIVESDFFMFSISKLRVFYPFSLTTNWFVHAKKPGNVIMKDLVNLSFEYWRHEDTLIDYGINCFLFALSVEQNNEAKKIFDKMPYIPDRQHFLLYLTKHYSKSLFEILKRTSHYPVHKLFYRERLHESNTMELWDEKSSLWHFLDQEGVLD